MNREIKFRVWDFLNKEWAREAESVMLMGLQFDTKEYFNDANGVLGNIHENSSIL